MQDRSVGRTVMVILAAVVAAGGVSAAVTGVRPGFSPKGGFTLAAGMPDWNISEICASDSASGQCRILEAEAQRTISGGWGAVPESFRKACMDSVKSPYDKSYRLLSQCLEAQVLKGLDKDIIDTAKTAGPLAQAAPAAPAAPAAKAAPAVASGGGKGLAVLPTTSTADLFKMRESWGAGAAARKVEAPLAAGATSPLPSQQFAVPKGFEGQPTVHPLKETPVAQLTPVPQDKLADEMKKLLAERAGWGTAPGRAAAASAAAAPAPGGDAAGLAVLPTTSTADLFKMRESWGAGAAPRKVEAPLATGASSPLPSQQFVVPKGFDGQPTVHPLKETPVAQLTPVPQDKLAAELKKLLAEREGWLKAPSKPAAEAAAPAAAPAAGGSGFAVLPTTSTADLFKMRESWGAGAAAKKVEAPLAAGSSSPLPSQQFAVPKGFDGQPTVHALKETPVPQLTPVPQDKLADEMKKLLAERAGWGTAPGKAVAGGSASAGGSGSGYAVLPTTSTADLFKMREGWGAGAAAKKVVAPLAAGAKSPLPSQQFAVPKGFDGQPTVHPLKETPVAQLTPVPQDKLADEMKKLLAERAGWGTAPSKVAAAPAAAPKSAEAADCEAKLEDAASKGVILFQTSSARIDAKSNATLNALATIAKGCSKGRIRVGGHTDSTGRAAFNKTLSERRAQAVADYLTKAGVPKARVEAVGYGSEKPVADNDTSEGRAKNRRIEFDVLD